MVGHRKTCDTTRGRRVPKPRRVKDPKAVEAVRKRYCELCGCTGFGMQVHHIITKGSGGPDHPCNLISLCPPCHSRAHAGRIAQEVLWRAVGHREGMPASEIEQAAAGLARQAHVGEAN